MARRTSTPGSRGSAGGYVPGGTDVPVTDGGTGASTAAAARVNLGIDVVTTFSNADATAVATTKILAQIGTMSASRAVTLPAASAVSAGYEMVIADVSGTVTATNTIVVTRAGADTINGATTATIAAAYGWRRLVSDGTSKWTFDGGILRSSNNLSDVASTATTKTNLGIVAIASSGSASDLSTGTVPTARLGSGSASSSTYLRGDQTWAAAATSRALWKWNQTDVSQFTLSLNPASTNSAITKITSTNEPYTAAIQLDSVGGGTAGYRAWLINDFTPPASGRWIMKFRMGKRSANIIPVVWFAYQDGTHNFAIQRDPTNTSRPILLCTNNTTFASGTYSACALTSDLGSNTGTAAFPGAFVELEVNLRQPSSGVDPSVVVTIDSRSEASIATTQVASLSTAYTGGSPPSGGWHASWQSGGNLGVAIGCYGSATADTSFLADLVILKHPLDE